MEIESDREKAMNLVVIQLQIAQTRLLHMMHTQPGVKAGEVFELVQEAVDLISSLPSGR